MDSVTIKDNGIIVVLKVIPNSSKNELMSTETGLRLKITAPPVDNKANKFVIGFLSKRFKVPKTSIKIVRGDTSRDKTIFISADMNKCIFIKDTILLL